MNDSSMVYVVQDPEGKNIHEAKAFGKLHVILTGRESMQEAVQKLQILTSNFRKQDFLLLVGKSINMGLAVHLALTKTGGELNLLVWRRESQEYTIEYINIYECTDRSNQQLDATAYYPSGAPKRSSTRR